MVNKLLNLTAQGAKFGVSLGGPVNYGHRQSYRCRLNSIDSQRYLLQIPIIQSLNWVLKTSAQSRMVFSPYSRGGCVARWASWDNLLRSSLPSCNPRKARPF